MGTSTSHEQQTLARTLADVRFLVMSRSFQTASRRLGELRHRLEQHLDLEGRLVPVFITRTGDPGQLAPRLLGDHQRLAARIEAVCSAIAHWNSARALYELDRLGLALDVHGELERELLHPALDDLVADDTDWDSLRFQLPRQPATS